MGTTKIAVITGGSRSIGRSAAEHLARCGAGIINLYLSNEATAKEAVRTLEKLGARAAALPLDIRRVDSFADFAGQVKQALRRQRMRRAPNSRAIHDRRSPTLRHFARNAG